MRKDLKLLPWLTAEQALTALRDMTQTDLTFSDLISHCQYHNCNAFITASGLGGIADTPILIGEDDWSYKCFAHGPQRVLNAEVLVKTLGISHANAPASADLKPLIGNCSLPLSRPATK